MKNNTTSPVLSSTHPPAFKEKVAACHPSIETLELLLKRRSLLAKDIGMPGPTPEQLEQLLQIGARVPDHGVLAPWRFLIFQEEKARLDFGEVLASVFIKTKPNASEEQIEFERQRFSRVPLVVGVVSCVNPEAKIAEWEQILSSGAVCQNIVIAANAMGFASQWLTEWYAYDPETTRALGLGEHEKIAGFIFIGTAQQTPTERRRPDLSKHISHWKMLQKNQVMDIGRE